MLVMKGSINPEARQRTLELLTERGETTMDWVARLRYSSGMTNAEIIKHAVGVGFIDEEIEGVLIDLDVKFPDKL